MLISCPNAFQTPCSCSGPPHTCPSSWASPTPERHRGSELQPLLGPPAARIRKGEAGSWAEGGGEATGGALLCREAWEVSCGCSPGDRRLDAPSANTKEPGLWTPATSLCLGPSLPGPLERTGQHPGVCLLYKCSGQEGCVREEASSERGLCRAGL